MPAKLKFTQDELINRAIDIVRRDGIDALSARTLAKELSSSSKPIFSLFENMEDLKYHTFLRANNIFNDFVDDVIKSNKYPPYKATGMAYIDFAIKEPNLFKLLFMHKHSSIERSSANEDDKYAKIIESTLNIDFEMAKLFHLEMWMFVHGIATTITSTDIDLDIDTISMMLTDQFMGLKKYYLEERNGSNKNS